MRKKVLVLSLFITSVLVFVAGGVLATDQLEEEQERIQEEREAIQSDLSEAEDALFVLSQRLHELNSELSKLNEAIASNEALIAEVQEDYEENEAEIHQLEEDIELLQNDIDQRFELLRERAVSYQKNGTIGASFIEVILGAEGFGDFISRVVMVSRIAQADNNFIEQLETNQNELEKVQKEYELTLLELEEQLEILEILTEDIEEQRTKTLGIVNEVKEKEVEQEALITQLATEDKNLASLESEIRNRIEEEIRRQEELQRQEEARLAAQRQAEREARERAEREAAEKENNPTNNEAESENNPVPTSSDEGDWQTFIATAYTAYCDGCSGITFTGIDLRANPDAKVIAVDPSVIPLGSLVEVEGYGTYLAGDIGGAINGRKIDIFMSDINDALNFGLRTVKIRVLD